MVFGRRLCLLVIPALAACGATTTGVAPDPDPAPAARTSVDDEPTLAAEDPVITAARAACRAEPDGSMTPDRVQDCIVARMGGVQLCYAKSLQGGAGLTEATLRLRLRVDRDGRVTEARARLAAGEDPELEACVEARAAIWRFPGGPLEITYPIHLRAF